jgi:hypothetical protein
LAALCLLATFAYVGSLPWALQSNDEGLYLYEAKRILLGDAMYRDFFHFVAPGAWYLMAGVYAIFGTSIASAKLTAAFVHAVSSACLFASSRQLGASQTLALAAPLLYCMVCVPSWPVCSPHWVSTMLTCLLLVVLLRDGWLRRHTDQLLVGALIGLVAVVQQHKGAVLGPVVALLVVVLTLLEGASWRELAERLSMLTLGVLVTVVPVLGSALYLAGFDPTFEALVVHPLLNYAPANSTPWGSIFPLAKDLAANTYPNLLRWSPIVLPATLALALGGHLHSISTAESRRWLSLSGVTAASLASALYYPDFVHIAFAAPPAIVSAVALAAWCGHYVSRRAGSGRAVALGRIRQALAGLLLAGLTIGAFGAWHDTARGYDREVETRFGRVAVDGPTIPWVISAAEAALQGVEPHGLYVHNFPPLYLYLDADNPTPFQIINVANPLEHDQRIIEILEDQETEIVVTVDRFVAPRPSLLSYLGERYELVEESPTDPMLPVTFRVLRRNR